VNSVVESPQAVATNREPLKQQQLWNSIASDHGPSSQAKVYAKIAKAMSKRKNLTRHKIASHFKHMHQMKKYAHMQKQPRTQVQQVVPEQWDWRNVSGINFVTPAREQQLCGSCYAFASLGMYESRAMIQQFKRGGNSTSKKVNPVIFSPQDIVSCGASSSYNQGCDGGFNYLVGKYAYTVGIVPERCSPYYGDDLSCKDFSKCPPSERVFATSYEYVGGYYGATTEQLMMKEIYENGPIAASFFVYDDFYKYKDGIYHHIPTKEAESIKQQEHKTVFEATNHAILLVGYGKDEQSGEKYWIGKNSWSSDWGIQGGFFKIRRGNDECAIESLAVTSQLQQL